MTRGHYPAVALILCALVLPASAIKATVLHSGHVGLWITDAERNESRRVVDDRITGMAAFSPDGRNIAYVVGSSLHTMRNDGTDQKVVNQNCRPDMEYMAWTERGIFWMQGYMIARYDLATNVRQEIKRLSGEESEGFWMARSGLRGMSWCTRGTKPTWDDPRLVFSPDFSTVTLNYWLHISHGQVISSDGQYAIYNDFNNVSRNPGYAGHKSVVVQKFGTTEVGRDIVAFANFPSMDSTMPNHHPMFSCWNDPDYLVCNTRGPGTYIVNWRTEELWKVHRPMPDKGFYNFYPSALWMGDLPSATPTARPAGQHKPGSTGGAVTPGIHSVRCEHSGAKARIVCATPRDGPSRLSVYSLCGTPVASLMLTGSHGTATAIWDRTDRNGEPVAPGTYVLRLRAPDGAPSRPSSVRVFSLY